MSQVVSFVGYTPPARFDAVPWETARIEEAATEDGTWVTIDTLSLGTPDVDPSEPAARSFSTVSGTDVDLWYRVVFIDGDGNESEPTAAIQNIQEAFPSASAYADPDELARILHITNPSTEKQAALERVLLVAAGEINSEIGLTNSDLSGWQLSLAVQVNLDRAADLWRHTESIPGMTGLLGEGDGFALPGRYSWERYAQRLAPLKVSWGLA